MATALARQSGVPMLVLEHAVPAAASLASMSRCAHAEANVAAFARRKTKWRVHFTSGMTSSAKRCMRSKLSGRLAVWNVRQR